MKKINIDFYYDIFIVVFFQVIILGISYLFGLLLEHINFLDDVNYFYMSGCFYISFFLLGRGYQQIIYKHKKNKH